MEVTSATKIAIWETVVLFLLVAHVTCFSNGKNCGRSSRQHLGSTAANRLKRRSGTNVDDSNNINDDSNNCDSLSHWLSSPERYAERLGLTVEQVRLEKAAHHTASQTLQEQLATELDGTVKHQLVCQHRFQYGKHPFVCHKCWSYRPICLCSEVPKPLPLPESIHQVIVWTHHREWGSISNSGSLLPLMLRNTQLLMKGLPQHDSIFQTILDSEEPRILVLWPDNDISTMPTKQQRSTNRISWEELQDMLAAHENDNTTNSRGLTLVTLEGTWRTARRMASKLPPHVLRVALPPYVASWHNARNNPTKRPSSLLQPLRQQEGGSPDNLCTAEAVTAALVGLGMSECDGHKILDLVQTKVDRTRRYQGKRTRLF